MDRVTIRDVAAEADVSRMTVSRVLRGDSHVSPATREHVEKVARRMGYQFNPLAGAVMAQLRRGSRRQTYGKLAWLRFMTGRTPNSFLEWEHPPYEGARQRAKELGFVIECFRTGPMDNHTPAFNDVLFARGVQGVVLVNGDAATEWLDTSRFVCVGMQRSCLGMGLNVVETDAADGMILALASLRKAGYERIGLMLSRTHHLQSQGAWLATFLLDAETQPRDRRVRHLLLPSTGTREQMLNGIQKWYAKQQPNVILCGDETAPEWMAELGLDVPGDVGLAHLNRHPHLTDWAGIDQREDRIGAAAVDQVVNQLVRGESGLPTFQQEVLIRGEWVWGNTVKRG